MLRLIYDYLHIGALDLCSGFMLRIGALWLGAKSSRKSTKFPAQKENILASLLCFGGFVTMTEAWLQEAQATWGEQEVAADNPPN